MTRTKQIQLFLLLVFAIVNIHVANAEKYEKNYMVQSHLDSLSRIAPMLGESAIVDKETGRVFWQGGKQSLFDSVVGHSYLSNQQEGVLKHVRATLFSCILWMSFIRYLSEWGLKQKILSRLTETLTLTSERVLDVIRILTRAALFCLACLPKFNREFIVVVAIMYFLESYTCSTRKYLDNTLSCPDEIESFMEGLREEEPCVSWKIRCYHYEKRKWLHLVLLIDVWKYFSGVFQGKNTEEENNLDEKIILGPSMFTKKVISHQMKKVYQVRSCKDETIGGIWKQAQAATTVMAAFTKISLYKLLLFANKEARIDYFQQQSDFISREGKTDVYAEFSTHVDVKGYREKALAVRPTNGVQKLFDVRYFWLFTIMGLTVPYRIRFGKHCDELRVAVVKETSAVNKKSFDKSSTDQKSTWLSTPRSWFGGNDNIAQEDRGEKFKKHMQEISLYQGNRAGKVLASQDGESDGNGINEITNTTINATEIETIGVSDDTVVQDQHVGKSVDDDK